MKDEEISELVKHRLEQAQVALDDAKFLLEGKRSAQSIINRSYYAMFYAALALLQSVGKAPSKHSGVVTLFDSEFALKGLLPKELSKDFHKAFELRQLADYKVVSPSSIEKAEEIWKKAAVFLEAVKKYLLATFSSLS